MGGRIGRAMAAASLCDPLIDNFQRNQSPEPKVLYTPCAQKRVVYSIYVLAISNHVNTDHTNTYQRISYHLRSYYIISVYTIFIFIYKFYSFLHLLYKNLLTFIIFYSIQRAAELRTRHRALNFWFFNNETLVCLTWKCNEK